MSAYSTLPDVPVKHSDFIPYIASNPQKRLPELLEPFKQYDAKLRQVFAQEPDHPALADNYLNIVPLFDGHQKDVTIRARNLDAETQEEKDRYIMPLEPQDRRPHGSPAIVHDIKDFQQNFALFTESSLVDLDWTNVVAAGSSVVTCLLPVPDKYKKSKKSLRHYYHEKIAPASDVDLFIYGLTEEEAIKKILDIEQRVKDSILTEITTIRTKNAITIASQYPTRHIQIVLRVYKSVAEILTGFDVDCSCAAYDGKQVYAAPRALTAFMTQTNTIDLTRRSPSYENRLSKYSRRGFEVYWPLLDRSRIDPTIFERNFGRTVGLARLLVLERLPTKYERESYMDERRRERGRPAINRPYSFSSKGNIKERFEDEVAEWVEQEDVSDYHTFTIPYGPKYHAKKIEKLLYTKDLLLNAEWNKQKDREVNLHRHPAFFGYATDIIHDCCGSCPAPVTDEEHVVAEEEAKIYVSGEISFIKDDPGRQAIGSFHPLTDDDWTEMAYVGNTARLCQAIVDCDLEHVEDWLAQEGADPNCRDYTGRTPLHLAVVSSTPEIVKSLIDHGARLVARLADGRTALHLAAARGDVEMVRMIMNKSEENEEEEAKKEDARKQARIAERQAKAGDTEDVRPNETSEESDAEMIDADSDEDEDMHSTTTGSYIKVKNAEREQNKDSIPEEEDNDPDVYDVNVLSWDTKCSPLHYAILGGHIEVVKELVQTFGADVLLPIKLLSSYDKSPRGAILTLILALNLPLEKALEMTRTLLELGATSAQADMHQTTALQFAATKKPEKPEVLDIYFQQDGPAAMRILNHMSVFGSDYSPEAWSPLMSAIYNGNSLTALKLLEAGASPTIAFKDWVKSVEAQFSAVSTRGPDYNLNNFLKYTHQPIVLAVQTEVPEVALALLERGANTEALPPETQYALQDEWRRRYQHMETVLDMVRSKIQKLQKHRDEAGSSVPKSRLEAGRDYLQDLDAGTYKHFIARIQVDAAHKADREAKEKYEEEVKANRDRAGSAEKEKAVTEMLAKFKQLEKALVAKGAKTFEELHPDIVNNPEQSHDFYPRFGKDNQGPFAVAFNFNVHDLTDDTREAYLELFQAAWDGDLDKIKSLTLAPRGPDRATPLKIAVRDQNQYSPFSIAVLRGHRDVAKAIVEIAFAQYEPVDKPTDARYRMEDDDSDEKSEACSDSGSDRMQVYKTIVDDTFTIDNIGEVATQVKSNVQPLGLISWECPVWEYEKMLHPEAKLTYGIDDREAEDGKCPVSLQRWAIITNDKDLFTFMVDLDYEWTQRSRMAEIPDAPELLFDYTDFQRTIKYGRLDMLAEEIRLYGAGIELEALVKQSGVKLIEKPRYYQGLSVHGRKREDWVNAARGTYKQDIVDQTPPLLRAAFDGSLASVEWFLSDTPARLYREFGETNKDNKYIKHLNTSAGGFDKVVSKWLGVRREYAMHCAVMAEPSPESLKLIRYLLQVMPDSVNTKSITMGHTPLALAFSLGRLDAAKLLIEAGADQTVRDKIGSNILHLLLVSPYTNANRGFKDLHEYLNLIDKRLIPSLLNQRCSYSPGSLTPLARWQRNVITFTNLESPEKVLRAILDLAKPTNNEHLELFDASGETPLHFAVKNKQQSFLRIMLSYRADLLYRENSVGCTPMELAKDNFLSSCVQEAPKVGRDPYRGHGVSVVDKLAEEFVKKEGEDGEVTLETVWKTCEEFAARSPGKRKLVSLAEANEVANRLAEWNTQSKRQRTGGRGRYGRANEEEEGSVEGGQAEEGEGDRKTDEVAQWFPKAVVTWFDKGPRAWAA
ncbi:ankyrin repeat protein [Westerdykella ornata]|uniref:Ankyrin repeat protein n=1 Tax=Westerdykella ornata TaxID=318751 RepID=A0A6A6JAP3_WESOR|nr:ankyrin repeat protein [Westerdykella ornata]KAF2273661.1 ankyrin repeat protein [Westerdykella ornata]